MRFSPDDPIKSVLILGDGPYKMELHATADGSGSLHISQPKEDGRIALIQYGFVPFSSNTEASLNITGTTGGYPLSIDSDKIQCHIGCN
jgi:hypothetical protein